MCTMDLIARRDERPTSKYRQYVGVLVVTFAAFSIGTYLSWTSFLLPFNENYELFVSDQEFSWFISLVPLGATLLAVPTRMLTDKFGRKKIIWVITVPLFLCWYIIGYTESKTWIFLARFAAGAATGAASVVVPVFTSEIVERSVKKFLVAIFQLQFSGGILFVNVIAFTHNSHVIAILCSVAPALLLLALPFVPESPMWLIMQGRRNEASDVLKYYRGSGYCAEAELSRLETHARAARPNINWKDRKAIGIAFGLITFQQLSGVSVLISYALVIEDAHSMQSPITLSVIVGIVQVITSCASIFIIERAGKKILLFISLSVMSVCMFTLSGYFRFQNSHDLSNVTCIPLVAIATFIAMFSIGFGPIPWLMIEELIDDDVMTRSIIATCTWTLTFLVTKCFSDMRVLMGSSSSFATFGLISLIGIVFVSKLVPETGEGRVVEEEIQIELHETLNRRSQESMVVT